MQVTEGKQNDKNLILIAVHKGKDTSCIVKNPIQKDDITLLKIFYFKCNIRNISIQNMIINKF